MTDKKPNKLPAQKVHNPAALPPVAPASKHGNQSEAEHPKADHQSKEQRDEEEHRESETEYESPDDPWKGKHSEDGDTDEDGQWHDYPDSLPPPPPVPTGVPTPTPNPNASPASTPAQSRQPVPTPAPTAPPKHRSIILADAGHLSLPQDKPHEKWVSDCKQATTCWCGETHCGAGTPR